LLLEVATPTPPAPFQAAATMLLPGEVTATAWLPTCDVVSARQCSYPINALSQPGSQTVAVTLPAKSMAAVA